MTKVAASPVDDIFEAVAAKDMVTRRYLNARVVFCVLLPALYAPVVVELVITLGRHDVLLERKTPREDRPVKCSITALLMSKRLML